MTLGGAGGELTPGKAEYEQASCSVKYLPSVTKGVFTGRFLHKVKLGFMAQCWKADI